jgi:hypothetical protein
LLAFAQSALSPAPAAPAEGAIAGTGNVVGSWGEILTNAHVIEQCGKITVQAQGGDARTASLIARNDKDDLAVIRAAALGRTFRSPRQLQPLGRQRQRARRAARDGRGVSGADCAHFDHPSQYQLAGTSTAGKKGRELMDKSASHRQFLQNDRDRRCLQCIVGAGRGGRRRAEIPRASAAGAAGDRYGDPA